METITAWKIGREYAQEMAGEAGFDSPVDIEEMVTSSRDIPDGDYRFMRDHGIDPDAREYWQGFNSFFDE